MQIYSVFVPLHDKPIIPKVLDSLAAAAEARSHRKYLRRLDISEGIPMFTTAPSNIGMYQPVPVTSKYLIRNQSRHWVDCDGDV